MKINWLIDQARQRGLLPADLVVKASALLGVANPLGIKLLAAPIYLKFGLRNAPNIYPSGIHLEQAAQQTGRERVRRASQCWHACHRISN